MMKGRGCWWLILCASALVTFAPLMPHHQMVLELCEQYRLQIVGGMAALMLVTLCLRQWRDAVILVLLTLFQLYWTHSPSWPSQSEPVLARQAEGKPFRLLSFNKHDMNKRHDAVVALIKRADPDIAVIPEGRFGFAPYAQQQLSVDYPYHQKGNYEVVLSKYPFEVDHTIRSFGLSGLHVKVQRDGQALQVIAIHLSSPYRNERIALRNKQSEMLKRYVETHIDPAIPLLIAGDFNSVLWQPSLRPLLTERGLMDVASPSPARLLSWPSWLPEVMRVPIDHILYNDRLVLLNAERLPATGSDHFPLLAEFGLLPGDVAEQ